MGRDSVAAKARRQGAAAAAASQGALSEGGVGGQTQAALNRYDPNGRDKETIDLLVRNTPFTSESDAKFGYDPEGRDKENLKLLMARDTPFETMTNKEFLEVIKSGFNRAYYARQNDGMLTLNPNGYDKLQSAWYNRSLKLESTYNRLRNIQGDVMLSRRFPAEERRAFVKALMATGDAAVRLKLMAQKPYRFTKTELNKIYKDGTASFNEARAITRRLYRIRTKVVNEQMREIDRRNREEVKRMSPAERRRYEWLVNDKPMPLRRITLSSGRVI